MAPGALMDESK